MKTVIVNREARIIKGELCNKKGNLVSYDDETKEVQIQLDNVTIVKMKSDCIYQEEDTPDVEPRKDGCCPHCGHHNEDEYREAGTRQINEKVYEAQFCTQCGVKFDKVYELKLVQSQKYKTTNQIIKDGI